MLGTAALVLLAFGMQIGLTGIWSLSNATPVIALLMLRMVPDSLARPVVVAQVQPLLADGTRATYLSLQSFCGRMLFALSLLVFSTGASGEGKLVYDEIQGILGAYLIIGAVAWTALALTAGALPRRLPGRSSDLKDG